MGYENNRYRRYANIAINPILSESSSDEEKAENNLDSSTGLDVPNSIILAECNN